MAYNLRFLIFLFWSLLAVPAFGQITFGGLAEFEIRKGGNDSDPTINQTPNGNWIVYVPSVRLFVNSAISENWYISGALQSDYYTGHRSDIFVSSFNLNWLPTDRLRITAGRFITPFGRYDELLLSSANPFVHLPLSHVWNMPVDRKQGYVFSGTSYDGVAGQSLVYRRLYTQGLMISGTTENDFLQYQVASVLTSVSSYTDVGEQNRPAFIGRLVVRPVIWNKTGISFARGPYLVDDPINDVLSDEKRSEYLQTIVSAFTEFSYHYFQLLMEYTFNRWDSPWINSEGELVEDFIENDVTHYMTKFKVRFPFWVGGYGAVRYERYLPHEIRLDSRGITGQPTPDKDRFEFVMGYKINRNLTLKTSYLLSRNDGEELNDDVFSVQLSASF